MFSSTRELLPCSKLTIARRLTPLISTSFRWVMSARAAALGDFACPTGGVTNDLAGGGGARKWR